MADDDRQQAEVDAEGHERRPQRDAGHDAGQGDRQDQDRNEMRLLAEEREPLHRERRQRAEDERDRGRDGRHDERVDERLARSAGLLAASPNQWSVNPVGGQAWIRLGLNA